MRGALISPIFVSHWLAYCLTGGDKMEKIVDENLSVSISCRGLWAAETGAHCFVSNVYQRAWLNCCVQGNSLIAGKQHCVLKPLQPVIVDREQNKAKDTEVSEETSDQPTVKEYNISYALCCHTKSKTGMPRICCCSHFPLSSQSSFFLFIAGGNKPGPFAEADLLPLAITLCFVSKGQGSPAWAACPAVTRQGRCLAKLLHHWGTRLTSPDCT